MKTRGGMVTRGVAAGAVAATAMALWFLLVDASRGEPFRTPAFLASALLDLDEVERSFGLVALYTALHYGAFVLIGLVMAWMVPRLGVVPNVLLGLALGFGLFDLVFYAGVMVTGVDVVAALGWPEVLAGNLIAGIALMGVLHLIGVAQPVTWWAALAAHRVIREGILAGLVGAAAVAAWFLIFDTVRHQPFFTPAALGSALFYGASTLADVQINAVTVASYTVVHLAAFILTGVVATAIVCEAENTPPLILGAVLLFAAFEAFFLGLLALVAEWLLGALAWWTIAIGNLLATAGMGYYLWRQHPKLQQALKENPLDRTL